jgi:DNA-binding NarL/FixJ family response regulator
MTAAGDPAARLLVVDDHPLVTTPLVDALAERGLAVEVAATAGEARTKLAKAAFDLCVLDLNLPDENGLDLLAARAAEGAYGPAVVVVSGVGDADEIGVAFDLGAIGFVSKAASFRGLVAAMLAFAAGGPTHPAVWDDGAGELVDAETYFAERTCLTPRERAVFRLLKLGVSDKEIAHRLGRSIHTVRAQVRSVLRKKGINRRAERL